MMLIFLPQKNNFMRLLNYFFLIAFTFIIFFMMSRAFAENGSLNALLAVWLPNIIFGLLTIYLYRLIPK